MTQRTAVTVLIMVFSVGILVGFALYVLLVGVDSADEARVRQFIIKNAENPASVVFVKWGPHAKANQWYMLEADGATREQMEYMIKHGKPMPAANVKPHPSPVYRVVYRDGVTRDTLFIMGIKDAPDLIIPRQNFFGDDWIRTSAALVKEPPRVPAE